MMKLVFVNIMHELYNLDSTASLSQPPVPLGVLNTVTPKAIETLLADEQTDKVCFDGDAFAFTVATQFAGTCQVSAPCEARIRVLRGGFDGVSQMLARMRVYEPGREE